MDTYRRSRGGSDLEYVDITAAAFDPASEGLDVKKVHKHLHVRRSDGSLAVGIDAFIEIWNVLPGYRWLARVVRLRPFKWLLSFSYKIFAEVRPYLPRRKRCDEGCER